MDRPPFYVERSIFIMLNKKTVDDLKDLKGKKVLVRCDFNVPLKDGVIQNYNRIDGAIPTIKKLLDQGAKVILLPFRKAERRACSGYVSGSGCACIKRASGRRG